MLGKTDSCVRQLLGAHLLYKVHSLFSTLRQSLGQNNQHTHCISFSFFFFLWDLVFVAQSKTKEEICWVELTPLWVISSLSSISCTKFTFCSAHKDSPVAKTITHSLHILFLFLWDLVFVAQSKTKEEICWVELTHV